MAYLFAYISLMKVVEMENQERAKRDLSGLRIERDEREQESGRRGLRAVALTTLLLIAVAGSIVAYRVWGVSLRFPEVEVSRAVIESGITGDEILTATGYIVAHRK